MRNEELIAHLLTAEGVILARDHPELRNALARASRDGRLARVLPGTFADPAGADDLRLRALALCRWEPDAVISGRAAAALSYWPGLSVDIIEVAAPGRHQHHPGFGFRRRRVPPELVVRRGAVRLTSPSLTAVDLATMDFADPIDVALRSRQVSLASLREALALTPHRRGNAERARVLLDSRAEPWSAAERLTHRIYRRAGIPGWVANHRVCVQGSTYFLDIAFTRQRVAIEIDGAIHQTDRRLFESDRVRQNALVLDGWVVLRFTWAMLVNDPEAVVAQTLRALREADRTLNARIGVRSRQMVR